MPGTGITPTGNATLFLPSTQHFISRAISYEALHVLLSKLPPPHTRGVLKLEPLWSLIVFTCPQGHSLLRDSGIPPSLTCPLCKSSTWAFRATPSHEGCSTPSSSRLLKSRFSTALLSHDSYARTLSQMHGQKEVSHPPLLASPPAVARAIIQPMESLSIPGTPASAGQSDSCEVLRYHPLPCPHGSYAAPLPGTGVTPPGNATLFLPSTQ